MSLSILELSFEHHREALGIGESSPRISWKIGGRARSWTQEQYELEIRRGSSKPELYTVRSQESVLVPWPSQPLKSGEAGIVRVRSSGHGIETSWSKPQTVEAGLLSLEDWTGSLVHCSNTAVDESATLPTLFRRGFKLTKEVSKARLYITAHGVYEAEINGTRIGDHVLAPGWTPYQHELPYQTFDVTKNVKAGDNVIGVHVAEGWYCGRLGWAGGTSNIWGDRVGVIAQLHITYEDGSTTILTTDSAWKAASKISPIRLASIYDGETYDLSQQKSDWSSPGLDDQHWAHVDVSQHDKKLLRAPDGPPIRRVQTLPTIKVQESPTGKKILDFGQNLVGWVRIKVPRGSKGHKIELIHTEVLENGECATRPLRVAKATDTLILSGDSSEEPHFWEPRFTFHGFRYVQVNDWPSEHIDPTDFKAIVIHTDMQRTGSFECSNPLLNRLHDNVIWSMRGNFVGIPTDCPQRDERLGWTGDIQAFAPTAAFLYSCSGMLKAWFRGLAAEQKAHGDGVPPVVSPNVLKPEFFPGAFAIWGDCTILAPWDIYQSSGDTEYLRAQFESMEDWIHNGIPRNKNGLWGPNVMGQLGDWLDPAAPPDRPDQGATDPMLVADAFLVRITDVMSQVCTVLGHHDKAEQYTAKAKELRAAFAQEYITASGRIVSDSQTAIALAIYFSLFSSSEQTTRAADRLEHLIATKSQYRIATGFAGTPILGHALTKAGKNEVFYKMLLNQECPSWLYPITMGATTIWERWDSMLSDGSINPGEMTSFNHYALGAVANWMHSTIGGISPREPGWKRFLVRPMPGGGVTSAKTSFESPYGMIKTEWVVQEDEMTLQLCVPLNTEAEVLLPWFKEKKILGSGMYEMATRSGSEVKELSAIDNGKQG